MLPVHTLSVACCARACGPEFLRQLAPRVRTVPDVNVHSVRNLHLDSDPTAVHTAGFFDKMPTKAGLLLESQGCVWKFPSDVYETMRHCSALHLHYIGTLRKARCAIISFLSTTVSLPQTNSSGSAPVQSAATVWLQKKRREKNKRGHRLNKSQKRVTPRQIRRLSRTSGKPGCTEPFQCLAGNFSAVGRAPRESEEEKHRR